MKANIERLGKKQRYVFFTWELGNGKSYVSAVHDNLGFTFHISQETHKTGDCLKFGVEARGKDGNEGIISARVLREVSKETVLSMLKLTGSRRTRLARGNWYEVIAD